jgi:CheY-like chemotaxis protein
MTTEEGTSTTGDQQVQILVVDDSDDLRESLRFALEDGGWPILEAANGAEALDVLRSTPHPTVVLLDQVMPELDGLGVLEAMANDPVLAARHAFILFTASAKVANVQERLNELAPPTIPLIRKPFDLDVLLDAIQVAVDRLKGSVSQNTAP